MSKRNPKSKQPNTAKSNAASAPVGVGFADWFPLLPAIGITFLAFLPTFDAEFVNWDDDLNIVDNPYIKALTWENVVNIFTHNIMGGYNPLSILTFAVENAVAGTENLSRVVHANNLVLHLVCVFFVYRIARALGLQAGTAGILALFFGIHPMRVESVAWATERKDVLFGAFYFAALWQYTQFLKSEDYRLTNKHLVWTFVLFVFSLFSKVQAVSLPLSMLALDYYFKRPLTFKLLVEKAHFFLGSLVYGVATIILLKDAKTIGQDVLDYGIFDKVIIGLHTYAVYLAKFIFPWEMSALYPYPKVVPALFYATPLVFIVSVAWILWAFRHEWRALVFGWAFFFVNFVFVSQVVGAGQGFLADRFTYVPYFGFFFIVAAYTEGWLKQQSRYASAVRVAFGAYAVVFFVMTWNQVGVWQNSETLWTNVLKKHRDTATPWGNRAQYYRNKKMFKQALADADSAIALSPKATAFNSRGKTLFDMGDANRAIVDYSRGIELDSTLPEIWANRGAAYGQLGKIDLALYDLNKALALDSVHLNALLNRSLAHQSLGNFAAALADDDVYLRQKTDNADAWFDRGVMKRNLNRCAEAIPDFDRAIALNDTKGEYFLERARCHYLLGNKLQARQDAQMARARRLQVDSILLE